VQSGAGDEFAAYRHKIMTVAAAKKRVRQPEITRQNILDAAKSEFASVGLRGARTAVIAKRAGVNVQAIFHHFGSKDALFAAVVVSLFDANWFLTERNSLMDMDPRRAIETIMDFMMDRARTDSHFIAILLDANLQSAKHLQGVEPIRQYYIEVLATIGSVLKKGRKENLLWNVDAEFFYVMLMGAIGSPLNQRRLMSATLGRDYGQDAELLSWYAAFKEVVMRGICKTPLASMPR
jgi:TetR/AcrR family transcriptional regulator